MNATASSNVISPRWSDVSTMIRAARNSVAFRWWSSWIGSSKKPRSRITRSAYSAQPSLKYGVE